MDVSVCITAYNHEEYITQCLNSVLMQRGTITYEILLGEDNSSDGTRKICEVYARNHSDKIKLFLRDRKDVIQINGRPTGRFNLLNLLQDARGKYICVLDGDDFWIDPLKLQLQYNFLEANPHYSACFHQTLIVNITKGKYSFFTALNEDTDITTDELIESNIIATSSSIFRKQNLDIKPWFKSVPVLDWPLHLLNSTHGKIRYMNRAMSAYRIHEGSTWQSRTREFQLRELCRTYDLFIDSHDFTTDVMEKFKNAKHKIELELKGKPAAAAEKKSLFKRLLRK
jgi:glycosyltransferase involved in cell wall biosynthesis